MVGLVDHSRYRYDGPPPPAVAVPLQIIGSLDVAVAVVLWAVRTPRPVEVTVDEDRSGV